MVGGRHGEWEDEHPLTAACAAGDEHVFITGWRHHQQLPQALNAADLLVLPSVAEAFGLVLIEAMASGLPVIACRTHGPAEMVVDGKTGWLVSPDDQDSLTDALLAAATGDQERLARGRRAEAESRHHGWPATIRRLILLYDELAALAPGRQTAREQPR